MKNIINYNLYLHFQGFIFILSNKYLFNNELRTK